MFLGSTIQGVRNHRSDELIVLAKQVLQFGQDLRHVGIIRLCRLCTELPYALIKGKDLHTSYVAPIQNEPLTTAKHVGNSD